MNYRNSSQIMFAMLDTVNSADRNGIGITNLISKANLNYQKVTTLLDKMIGSNLINKIEYDGRNTFVITERGRMYVQEYKKLSNLAESFGLEL